MTEDDKPTFLEDNIRAAGEVGEIGLWMFVGLGGFFGLILLLDSCRSHIY